MVRVFVFFDPLVTNVTDLILVYKHTKLIDVRAYPVTAAKYNIIRVPSIAIVDDLGNVIESIQAVDNIEISYAEIIQRIPQNQ